jgi:hypothetical protein
MVHVGLYSVGTYHKNFGWENLKNKNVLCRVSRNDTRQSSLAECQLVDTRQRIVKVYLPSAAQWALGKGDFAECQRYGTRQRIF